MLIVIATILQIVLGVNKATLTDKKKISAALLMPIKYI